MKRTILYRTLSGLLLTLVGALAFVGCTDNDDVSTLSGPVPVYLHVSADLLGDLNASRATDPYAVDGEFMNTLCVFVVNSNNEIEAKFGPDILDGYVEAQTGDLTDWTSDRIVLTTGAKTIYAFSNWETADSEDNKWAALIAKGVGETITEDDLNFVVDDPASKVDIANGKYIPMSGKEEVTITVKDLNYNPELIEVGLDRLVGKVTIAVNGDSETAVQLGDFTFTGWADKVPMMSDDPTTTYEYEYTGSYEATLDKTINAGETSSVTIATFYVNETYRPETSDGYDGFEITLKTNQYEGMTYTATTARTEIQRNHIYPILLTLDTYELVLTPTVWTSILGVDAEVEYDSPIYFADDTYYITLLEVTSTFSITPSLVKVSNNTTTPVEATWDWTYLNKDIDESTSSVDGSTSAITVTTLTATPGYEYGFTLVGEWTANDGATLHSRTYNVKVIFEEGFPSAFKASRAWWSRSYGSEMVRMKVR